MQQLARMKCSDPAGYPRRDSDGNPTEDPMTFDGQKFEFRPDEEVLIDHDIAMWMVRRPAALGRLVIAEEHPVIHAVIKGEEITLLDPETNKPVDTRVLRKANRKPPGGQTVQDGVVVNLGENPQQRMAQLNAALARGEKGDVTVGE